MCPEEEELLIGMEIEAGPEYVRPLIEGSELALKCRNDFFGASNGISLMLHRRKCEFSTDMTSFLLRLTYATDCKICPCKFPRRRPRPTNSCFLRAKEMDAFGCESVGRVCFFYLHFCPLPSFAQGRVAVLVGKGKCHLLGGGFPMSISRPLSRRNVYF